ncbi:MAG: hypothetical protein RXR20_02460 [Paraburkholderia sp.]|jgi:hypothetical protein|uniref:hypothetical protein n=1 Tax=Burkholderiaceae TaxID=119060 RepID=UPI0010F5D5FD|nr:hypothetical protein [Burkholderia sp. 4M9327F10]
MPSLKTLLRSLARSPSPLMPLGLLVIAVHANAGWTLVQADAPVTVIDDASEYRASNGQRLGLNDMVETPAAGDAQIQDDAGNSLLFGHDTRVMLMRDGQIALLQGWLKVLHACSAPNCAAAVIETAGTRVELGEATSVVIAAAAPNYREVDAVFCESGTVRVTAIGSPRGKPVPVRLDTPQFAARTAANPTLSAVPRPDPIFIAAMPVSFRDAVHPLPVPPGSHDAPARNTQPVSYDDVSDWLNSGLAARTQAATSFATRFRTRLSDPAFRREIKQHLRTLPDWRPLIYPAPRSTASAGPYPYHLTSNHP